MQSNGFDTIVNEFGILLEELGVGAFASILITFIGTFFLVGVLLYVLECAGLYTVAKRRQLGNAWLAWIPVGNLWTLGKIADEYTGRSRVRPQRLRVWLLTFLVAMPLMLVALFVVALFSGMFASMSADSGSGGIVALIFVMLVALFWVLNVCTAITFMVLNYMAYYRYFCSCRKDSAVLFLVLGIIFGFLMPIFVFALRKGEDRPAGPTVVPPMQ